MKNNKYLRSAFLTVVYLLVIGLTYLLFGMQNVALSIVAILSISKLSKDDFTISPKSELIKLMSGFLIITVMAEIASINVYLSIFINLITIFFIGALNLCTLDKGYYNTFILVYVYMLVFKTSINGFPIRLLGVVFCVGFIIFTKLYVFKTSYKDIKLNLLKDIINIMIKKIEDIKTDGNIKDLNEKLDNKIVHLNNLINNTRARENSLTQKDKCIMDFITVIEKINMMLQKINYDKKVCISVDKFMGNVNEVLEVLSKYLNKKLSIEECIHELNDINTELNDSDIYDKKILSGIVQFIKITIDKYIFITDSKRTSFKMAFFDIFNFEKIKNRVSNFHKEKNESFYFNLRMTLAITITYFLGTILDNGSTICLVLSAFAVIQVDSKNTLFKSLMKIKGTIVGSLLYVVLYKYLEVKEGRILIIVLAIYLLTLMKDYDKMMTFSTIISIGISELNDPSISVIYNKIFYIVIGVLLGLLSTVIIKPYKFSNEFKKVLEKIRRNDELLFNLLKEEDLKESKEIRNIMLDNTLMIDYLNTITKGSRKYKIFKLCHTRISVNEAFLFRLNRLKNIDKDDYFKNILYKEIEEDIYKIAKLKVEEI